MSYNDIELSNFDGKPIALYEFKLGTNYWRYTSTEEDIPRGVDGDGKPIVYKAVSITDGGITMSGDASNDDVTITLPTSEGIPKLYLGTPPSDDIYVYMRRKHYGDDDAPIVWAGTITSVKRKDSLVSDATCKMLTASFDRGGGRLAWGRQCQNALYDRNCTVNKALYAIAFQIEFLSGGLVGSSALTGLPEGWLSNGFFEWATLPGVLDRRGIENHSGTSFGVMGTLDGLTVGQWVTAYPGCPRTTDACVNKFNNLPNYGGVPALPGKSPFDGDPTF